MSTEQKTAAESAAGGEERVSQPDRGPDHGARSALPLALERSTPESVREERQRAALRELGKRVGASTVVGGLASLVMLPTLGPVAVPLYLGVAVGIQGVGILPKALGPKRALRETWRARALRKKPSFEGVVAPIEQVRSASGDCCAFDHVVQRCSDCDCVTPCSALGGEFLWEERRSGVFLVRGEEADLLVEDTTVHFDTTFGERLRSRFLRLDPGERVRVQGDFVVDEEGLPAKLRGLFGTHRGPRRLLRPAPFSSLLVHKLAPAT